MLAPSRRRFAGLKLALRAFISLFLPHDMRRGEDDSSVSGQGDDDNEGDDAEGGKRRGASKRRSQGAGFTLVLIRDQGTSHQGDAARGASGSPRSRHLGGRQTRGAARWAA